jgi:hypothetical protein
MPALPRIALVAALAACGGATVIERTPQGGIIELHGDHDRSMNEANQQMAAQCGANNYEIAQENDEPVVSDAGSGAPRIAQRIHFHCGR